MEQKRALHIGKARKKRALHISKTKNREFKEYEKKTTENRDFRNRNKMVR